MVLTILFSSNYAVEGKQKLGEFPMKSAFFNSELIMKPGKMDEYLKGMTLQPSQEVDDNVVEDVSLFAIMDHP